MSKAKISAKQVLNDINSGMSDAELMEKYSLTPKGLESLFAKLTEAGILNPASLSQRSQTSQQQPLVKSPKPEAPKPIAAPPKSDDSLVKIAQDIKDGKHDNEIMRIYELSPGKLREIKAKLVEQGHLEAGQVGDKQAKKTKTCPFCSQEVPEAAAKCAHCGEWFGGDSREALPDKALPPAEAPEIVSREDVFEGEKDCPWENRENYGTTKAYIKTATECLMRPSNFFSNLPLEGGYFNPILFSVMSGVFSIVLAYLWTSLFSGGLLGLIGLLLAMGVVFIGSLIGIPIILFGWSGLLHGCLCLVKGANEGFQTTFRVASYASVTSLFNALPIPYLGNIASLWGLVLTVIGLRETHKTTTGKAAAAVVISAGVVMAVLLIFFSSLLMAALWGTSSSKVPQDVCVAVRAFVEKVDATEDLDADAAEQQIQEAVRELEPLLRQFQNDKEVRQLGGKALAYQMAVLFQRQMGKAVGSPSAMNQLQSNLQRQRDELLACNPARKRK